MEENKNTIDKNELANLLDSYEESAKVIDEEKDEEGSSIRVFKNKYIKTGLTVFCAALVLYHVYALLFRLTTPLVLYSIHWGMGLFLVFLYYPISKKAKSKSHDTLPFYDALLALLVIVVVGYIMLDPDGLMYRLSLNRTTDIDLVFGTIAMVLSLEAARRTIGLGLPIVAMVFLAYAFWGNHLPSLIASRGYSYKRVISFIFSVEGIFGAPTKMSAQFVFLLIIFGAFLGVSGAGEFFMKVAMKAAGGSRGGPAKVAVIASGLFGSISGSAVANVVGTGVFTIPLMKKTGYKPHFAGAVEAVASTGGQIMPPVMGSGAFIMAELLGMKYSTIAICALIPALLYYLSIIIMVDLEAARTGLKGVDTSALEKISSQLKHGWNLLLPLLILILFLVVFQDTVSRSAVYAILAAIIGCALKKCSRLSCKQIIAAVELGVVRSISVIAAVACAGVAIGAIMLSGVGAKFTYVVVQLAQGNLLATLILSGLAASVLGMGLPTVAAYIIAASLLAPSIIQLGVLPFAAHMFLLYYSILSQITPPVALAAYAAGNIANADPNKVGFTAMRLGIIAFILPFFFVYGNALLLIGSLPEIILATVTALVGTFCLAIGLQGWFFGQAVNWVLRVDILTAALLCIIPGSTTDLIGIGLIIIFFVFHKGTRQWAVGNLKKSQSI
ncbi:MAG: TRAP transporter permease [Clostridiales bacterium]